jgi:hypothetical protein
LTGWLRPAARQPNLRAPLGRLPSKGEALSEKYFGKI